VKFGIGMENFTGLDDRERDEGAARALYMLYRLSV
jgi:hypothetical protein